MLVAMYVNIFTWQAERETYTYHLWLQNFTLRPLTTLLYAKRLWYIYILLLYFQCIVCPVILFSKYEARYEGYDIFRNLY